MVADGAAVIADKRAKDELGGQVSCLCSYHWDKNTACTSRLALSFADFYGCIVGVFNDVGNAL